MKKFKSIIFLLCSFTAMSQYNISGTLQDEYGLPVANAHIDLENICIKTSEQGRFFVQDLPLGVYTLRVNTPEYLPYEQRIELQKNEHLAITLIARENVLEEIIIHKTHDKAYNSTRYTSDKIQQNFAGSLASSLKNIAGVEASEIGSGASKPIIRGLGLNRVAVVENNIKQEGQQWGADHALEIDALQTEEVEIIKGVGAIKYGSDAIGGVIKINNEKIPTKGLSARLISYAKSVNKALGSALLLQNRGEHHFYKIKLSAADYADYAIPTNNIRYLNYNIPIEYNKLKNTAGNEYSTSVQGGYLSDNFSSILSIGYFYNKTGFFPGAHGVPNIQRALQDKDDRNIEYPHQKVVHTKVSSHTKWIGKHSKTNLVLGFQNNHRGEYSQFHTHYGNQKPPEKNPDLELDFRLNTIDAELSHEYEISLNHLITLGVQSNYQINKVSGYSYLMPQYTRKNYSIFATHHWDVLPKWQVEFGVRADLSRMKVMGYFDEILYQYLMKYGNQNQALAYAQRSENIEKEYLQPNMSIGSRYELNNQWSLVFTTTTNFRLPTAMELSANGIHHGAFRHEQGNPNLSPERGISSEVQLAYKSDKTTVNFSPFVYYFSNYIFLKPTGVFSILPHGGQVYQYHQSKALISGVDFSLQREFGSLDILFNFEGVFNKQISEVEYPLPFTPPVNAFAEIGYKCFNHTRLYANTKWANQQDRVAQNEDTTEGYWVLGIGTQTSFDIFGKKMYLNIMAENLLDNKYYNHTAFYRKIQIPEMGRNIQLMLRIDI